MRTKLYSILSSLCSHPNCFNVRDLVCIVLAVVSVLFEFVHVHKTTALKTRPL